MATRIGSNGQAVVVLAIYQPAGSKAFPAVPGVGASPAVNWCCSIRIASRGRTP